MDRCLSPTPSHTHTQDEGASERAYNKVKRVSYQSVAPPEASTMAHGTNRWLLVCHGSTEENTVPKVSWVQLFLQQPSDRSASNDAVRCDAMEKAATCCFIVAHQQQQAPCLQNILILIIVLVLAVRSSGEEWWMEKNHPFCLEGIMLWKKQEEGSEDEKWLDAA